MKYFTVDNPVAKNRRDDIFDMDSNFAFGLMTALMSMPKETKAEKEARRLKREEEDRLLDEYRKVKRNWKIYFRCSKGLIKKKLKNMSYYEMDALICEEYGKIRNLQIVTSEPVAS